MGHWQRKYSCHMELQLELLLKLSNHYHDRKTKHNKLIYWQSSLISVHKPFDSGCMIVFYPKEQGVAVYGPCNVIIIVKKEAILLVGVYPTLQQQNKSKHQHYSIDGPSLHHPQCLWTPINQADHLLPRCCCRSPHTSHLAQGHSKRKVCHMTRAYCWDDKQAFPLIWWNSKRTIEATTSKCMVYKNKGHDRRNQ